MPTAVIVVAAGSGSRLGAAEPKALVRIAGRTVLERALDEVFRMASAPQVIVVAPPERIDEVRRLTEDASVTVVVGGATRQKSVAAGLAALDDDIEIVLVHDAARAFTPTRLFDEVAAAVDEQGHGIVPGLPVVNTIKRTDDAGRVVDNVDRSDLRAVQTPQGFPRGALEAAYAAAVEDFTDDAALFAAAGHAVTLVEGDPLAFKITTRWDLRRAEQLIASMEPTPARFSQLFRTGVGIDVHAFDEDRPLWLGGLYWPDEPGLAGHSDGDALSHAICDALLAAAGLGDLGSRFGTADPRFHGAHGEVFLRETLALVRGAGFTVGNVAVQLVANRPKLSTRRTELESHLAELVGAPVSVAATTADGLGFSGRGEGVTAIATCLIVAAR